MTTHTPGPWRIDQIDDWALEIIGRPAWECERNGIRGEWDVAKIAHLDCDDETFANACLIAAAPELLKALRPFAECCEYIGETESSEEWAKFRLLVSHYRAARAAIVKATGGAS